MLCRQAAAAGSSMPGPHHPDAELPVPSSSRQSRPESKPPDRAAIEAAANDWIDQHVLPAINAQVPAADMRPPILHSPPQLTHAKELSPAEAAARLCNIAAMALVA